ncbi:hypothetical protein FHG87_004014 [Trinorchestia longiramus]|nr:hypothetical protein FHG87_004014 [Trinorchestia longiramus]
MIKYYTQHVTTTKHHVTTTKQHVTTQSITSPPRAARHHTEHHVTTTEQHVTTTEHHQQQQLVSAASERPDFNHLGRPTYRAGTQTRSDAYLKIIARYIESQQDTDEKRLTQHTARGLRERKEKCCVCCGMRGATSPSEKLRQRRATAIGADTRRPWRAGVRRLLKRATTTARQGAGSREQVQHSSHLNPTTHLSFTTGRTPFNRTTGLCDGVGLAGDACSYRRACVMGLITPPVTYHS